MMDNRRQVISYNQRAQKQPRNSFGMTLVFYSIFGALVALAMSSIPSFMLSMLVFFTYIMVMVSMTLITDFSSILLDTSDNTIILPRPVDSRTLFVARLTHILLYLGQLALGLSVIPGILVFFQYGLVLFLIFWVAVVLSIFTAVFITNGLYLIIIQFGNEEKLRSIINYFQIFMAIAIMGGYQILPRIMERLDMESFHFEIQWWSFLLPPVWMAGALEAFHFTLFDVAHSGLVVCALVLPILGIYIVNRYLSPVFNRKLAALNQDVAQASVSTQSKSNVADILSKWLTSTSVEQGAFNIIYRILGRDRKIKLKIYPAFGYIAVFGVIFMMRSREDFLTTWHNLPETQYHLMLLYLTYMVLQVAMHEIPYSDDFKASWVYHAAPLAQPGEILSGMLKAICARLFIPGFMIITIVVLTIWGLQVTDDILIGFFNNFLMIIILALINKRYLPLSMAPDVRAQSGNLLRGIVSFALIATLGLTHFLLTKFVSSTWIMAIIPVQLTGLYLLLRAYRKTSWNDITL